MKELNSYLIQMQKAFCFSCHDDYKDYDNDDFDDDNNDDDDDDYSPTSWERFPDESDEDYRERMEDQNSFMGC